MPLLLTAATLCPLAYGKIIHVDDDATGANDGTSWANAYVYLQDALADANDAKKPVVIRVAQGIYTPDQGAHQTLGDREATFRLIIGVTLRGGFAGVGEAAPNARDVEAYETTLSGDIGTSRFVTVEDNSYHVAVAPSSDGVVTMDGFTITGGNASGSGLYSCGGGLLNHAGNVAVSHCVFKNNSARLGGGVYNRQGKAALTDCRFMTNGSFQWGGGICNDGGELEVMHSCFGNNYGAFGGGVYDALGLLTMTNSSFVGNVGYQGGGVHCGKAVYEDPRTYDVTRSFIIHNETARLDRVKVWLPTLMECDSQRSVFTREASPPASNLSHLPEYGSGVRHWDIRPGPGRNQSLSLAEQFTCVCYAVHYDIDPSQIGPYEDNDPAREIYTRATKYIEADDPQIREKAVEIAGDETNPYWVAYTIYLWVIDHMRYQSVQGPKGAEFALNNGYGECGAYSALFAALCRAVGIPARPVVGRWASSSPGNWHVWGEFYLPGYGWIPVDATQADTTGRPEAHFGHLDNRRLTFNKTYNVLLEPTPHFFSPNVGFLQTYFWEYHGSGGAVSTTLEYDVKPAADKPVSRLAVAGVSSTRVMTNSIMWDNYPDQVYTVDDPLRIMYTDIQGGWLGEGNLDVDPIFADPESGDYRLKSAAGRWDPNSQRWVQDEVTSPCIDAGDPNSDWRGETWPHGERINMGAYGGTREASMSLRIEEMSLPSVAYIFSHNTEVAESFQSLLGSYGCPTILIRQTDVPATPLDSYDLVIVAHDTQYETTWSDPNTVAAIEDSSRPIVGLGDGGYDFFGLLGLSIGNPMGGHGKENSVEVVDPENLLFRSPYSIEIPEDLALQLYTETDHVGIYLWPTIPDTVTVFGNEVNDVGYFPLIMEHNHYLLWGFTESPEKMTDIGKKLFLNIVIRAANRNWGS